MRQKWIYTYISSLNQDLKSHKFNKYFCCWLLANARRSKIPLFDTFSRFLLDQLLRRLCLYVYNFIHISVCPLIPTSILGAFKHFRGIFQHLRLVGVASLTFWWEGCVGAQILESAQMASSHCVFLQRESIQSHLWKLHCAKTSGRIIHGRVNEHRTRVSIMPG